VVSGSILLSKREDFFRLHRDWVLPMMHKIGIRPVLLLMTEIGVLRHGLTGPQGPAQEGAPAAPPPEVVHVDYPLRADQVIE